MVLHTKTDTDIKPQQNNIRLTLEYDGTRYAGWQRQSSSLTIQQVVEDALSRYLGESIRLYASGRTDAGVHAVGQVAHFRTSRRLPGHAICRGTLAYLPGDIAIREAVEVDESFDARRSALLRWYRFYLSNRGIRPAVGSAYLTNVIGKLNPERMQAAAEVFTGRHDFSAFRSSACRAVRTSLDMNPILINQVEDGIYALDFRCRSFLQNMVRIVTGSIVSVGRGRLAPEDIRQMLQSGQRLNEARTLSPNGLFLYKVFYPGDVLPADCLRSPATVARLASAQ